MYKYNSILILVFILIHLNSFSQQICYDENHKSFACPETDTLIDNETSLKYILYRFERCIKAIDPKGNILWETNPWEQKAFKVFENDHANFMRIFKKSNYILDFYFYRHNDKINEEHIGLRFHNGEYGMIEKGSGRFYFLGND